MVRTRRALAAVVAVLLAGCSRPGPVLGAAHDRAVRACGWDPSWVSDEPDVTGARTTFFADDPSTVGRDRAVVWPDRVVCVHGEKGTVETVDDGGGHG